MIECHEAKNAMKQTVSVKDIKNNKIIDATYEPTWFKPVKDHNLNEKTIKILFGD